MIGRLAMTISCLSFLGMTRTHRVRRSYDHRLRDAIAATGNAYLFRNVPIPASTRRTWARGEVPPVVAAVDVELEVYELLEQVDKLRQRIKTQASIIGLLVRLALSVRSSSNVVFESGRQWGELAAREENSQHHEQDSFGAA